MANNHTYRFTERKPQKISRRQARKIAQQPKPRRPMYPQKCYPPQHRLPAWFWLIEEK